MSTVFRSHGSTSQGGSFSEDTKVKVWTRLRGVTNEKSEDWRLDICGNPIHWYDYGKTTKYGWEIDHIIPVKQKGSDHIENLQALQWSANRRKSDSIGVNYCVAG